MADIHAATSTYESGTNDTYTAVADNDDDVLAAHQNGPASAIVQIETILGSGTTLKGSLADLATRLAVSVESDGKVKDFSATTKTTHPGVVAEGMTGAVSFTDEEVIRYQATGDKLESTGYTLPAGTGVIATLDDTQTFTNKTLTTPTIGDFTNATHDHTNAANGGTLSSALSTGTFTTSSFTGSIGHTETFSATNVVGPFTSDPSSNAIGTHRVLPADRSGGSGAASPFQYRFTADADGTGGSVSVTITWKYFA